jgi:AcrR family transcriptional regulator
MTYAEESRGSNDERRERVFDAACQLIVESGAQSVTISALALRMGVSRQWIYSIYPDLESIYMSIYAEVRQQFLVEEGSPPTTRHEIAELLKIRGSRYLSMPPACAVVALAALHHGFISASVDVDLRGAIYANIQRTWVAPLVAAGFDREILFGNILVYMNVMFGLVIAMHHGLTEMSDARAVLDDIVDGLLVPSPSAEG